MAPRLRLRGVSKRINVRWWREYRVRLLDKAWLRAGERFLALKRAGRIGRGRFLWRVLVARRMLRAANARARCDALQAPWLGLEAELASEAATTSTTTEPSSSTTTRAAAP